MRRFVFLKGLTMADSNYILTPEGRQKLEEELHYLETEKRAEVGERIKVAREFGDISENSEYDEARNEQAKNEARIKELEELVENAVILDESTTDFSMASLGSTVKLSLNGGEPMEYALVSSNESNPAEHKISDQSPLGAGLIDMRAGDEKDIETPAGTIHVAVLEVGKSQA